MTKTNTPPHSIKLSKNASDFIRSVRGFMAVYIVAHHYLKGILNGNGPMQAIVSCGQEVVVTFLMISGFLCFLSINRKNSISWRGFVKTRFKKIYPLYFIALLVSVSVAWIITGAVTQHDVITFIGNLLCLQDNSTKPGLWFDTAGGNYALWYMSYQWWDYIILIFLVRFIPDAVKRRNISFLICFAAMLSYSFFPNHLSIIIWYYWIFELGCFVAMVHFEVEKFRWEVIGETILMLLVWIFLEKNGLRMSIGYHPLLEVRHFVFALFLLTGYYIIRKLKWHSFPLLKPFIVFSSLSYGIYLLHVPMKMICLNYMQNEAISLILAFFLTIILAYMLNNLLTHRQSIAKAG